MEKHLFGIHMLSRPHACSVEFCTHRLWVLHLHCVWMVVVMVVVLVLLVLLEVYRVMAVTVLERSLTCSSCLA